MTRPAIAIERFSPAAVLPGTFQPRGNEPSGFELPATGPMTAPAAIAGDRILIGDIALDGGFPEMAAENAAFRAGLRGRKVTIAELFKAAADLEQAYARAGFVFARVVAARQKLDQGGIVRITVIDGFIERVNADKLPPNLRSVVAAYFAPLIGKSKVRFSEVERATLLAGEIPGLHLASTLTAGEAPGGVTVILDGSFNLTSGSLTIDNGLPGRFGAFQSSLVAALNNSASLGEQVYMMAGGALTRLEMVPLDRPYTAVGLGALIPLGVEGFKLKPEYVRSDSRQHAADFVPETNIIFQKVSVNGSYSVRSTLRTRITATAGIDFIRSQSIFPAIDKEAYLDSYAAARLSLDWFETFSPQTSAGARLETSIGMGGRTMADAVASGVPLSRQGASPNFTTLKANWSVRHALNDMLTLRAVGAGQLSFRRPLLSSEQISLEGANGLAGMPPGSLLADDGAVVRLEAIHPLTWANLDPLRLEPYAFVARGWGRIHQPTAVQLGATEAAAVGVGVHAALPDQAMTLSVEVAHSHAKVRNPNDAARNRASLALAIQF